MTPRLSRATVVALARFLGWVAWHVARRDRRVALANLDLAFGVGLSRRQKHAVALESFRTFARVALDYFWFSRDGAERACRYVALDESVMPWLEEGALIAVTAHFGNWEILGQVAARRGVPLASVAKPVRNPLVDAEVNKLREASGQSIIPRAGALKSLVRILKNGGKVALVLDQDTRVTEGGVFVDFFGVQVPVSSAPAALALKLEIPIVPAFSLYEGGGRFRSYALAPLMPATIRGKTVAEITQLITTAIEQEIRRVPGQWLWMYKRWKRRMPGVDPSRYPFYADC